MLSRRDIAEEVRAGRAANGPRGPEKRGVGGGEQPRKKVFGGGVETAKAVDAGTRRMENGGRRRGCRSKQRRYLYSSAAVAGSKDPGSRA